MSSVVVLRRARKLHLCDSCARYSIKPGDQYLIGTVFPGEETSPYRKDRGAPVKYRECRTCAERYRRADRFDSDSDSVSAVDTRDKEVSDV